MKTITRREFIKAAAAAMPVAAVGCPLFAAEKSAKRPNIVFMFCDDLRYDCIGANGNDIIHTHKID